MYLDISQITMPIGWPDNTPLLIPIEPGQHYLDYDVVEKLMPDGWAANMHQGTDGAYNKQMPIGFNRGQLPHGAKIL